MDSLITGDKEGDKKVPVQEKVIEGRRNKKKKAFLTQTNCQKKDKLKISIDKQSKKVDLNSQDINKKPDIVTTKNNNFEAIDIPSRPINSSRIVNNISSPSKSLTKNSQMSITSSKLDLLKNEVKLNLKSKHSYYDFSQDYILNSKGLIQNYSNDKNNNQKIPLLFIDVSMNDNSKKRIVLYEGDSPKIIVEQFVKKNQLDEKIISQLCNIIEEKIRNNQCLNN